MTKPEELEKPVVEVENGVAKHETRDDESTNVREAGESRDKSEANIKKVQSKSVPSRKQKGSHSAHHPSPQMSGYSTYHQQGHTSYHPGMRGPSQPSAPYPPPYFPTSAPHDYRGHPPPHYPHQMPPMPHPGQYPGPHGHYAPNLAGRPGPPPYHPGYGMPFPGPQSMSYHGAPPPYPPSNHAPHLMPSATSDSASITSSRSKRSNRSSRKKRTIEGVHSNKDSLPPVAYTFCRTNSNVSASTVGTAPNVPESRTLGDESPYKRERIEKLDDERMIRRNFSNTSTTSSVSVEGFSLSSSYDGPKSSKHETPLMKASPKRRKAEHLTIETGSNIKSIFKKKSGAGIDSSKFQQLTMNDSSGSSKSGDMTQGNILFSLSTSPINQTRMESPAAKQKSNKSSDVKQGETEVETDNGSANAKRALHDGPAETPTPTGLRGDTEMMTDEHMLNKHLRGQSFTPLPHVVDSSGISPSNAFPSIGQQLSWSIAGDTPSLDDLANCSWEEDKDEKKRPDSTTSHFSTSSRNLVISPHNFSLFKDEQDSENLQKGDDGKDSDSVRISMLSPHSEIAIAVDGTSTPLPWNFETSEERENIHSDDKRSKQDSMRHHGYAHKPNATPSAYMWNGPAPPTPVFTGSKPPTPHFPTSFARSPMHGDRRDWFGHPTPGAHNDRVRNLRGRVPPGAHLAPMPLHIPPPMAAHHPLTSPMGIGPKTSMWSPHHPSSMAPPMQSPHAHMSPAVDMSQSKRKCLPLKPPIPSKFQGDMEEMKTAAVPEFTSLVNFPSHMSQKQAVNLPEGMRCCVMCGQARPCNGGKKKGGSKKSDGMGDKSYAIIPTQNKGLCTLCDVNVWVVCNSGLEIKWCKGCKNFRPWAAFGDKGLATKCLRCRERQREKYALQKEEKEKARLLKAAVKAK